MGPPDARREALDRARRAWHVSRPSLERRHGLVLPDAVDQAAVHLPADCCGARSSRRSANTSSTAPSSAPTTRTTSLRQVYEMTDRRFDAGRAPARGTSRGTLFAMVEIGVPTGCTTASGRTWTRSTGSTSRAERTSDAILDYHRHVDALVGASARARRRRDGGPRRLRPRRQAHGRRYPGERVAAPRGVADDACAAERRRSSLSDVGVDWARTIAWGDGGYYSRIFLNVRGSGAEGHRRPGGLRARPRRARGAIQAIPDEQGKPIGTRVFKPEEIYPAVNGVAPDLIVHFGDLLLALRRHGRRRRRHPHLRERHGSRRREPCAGRPDHHGRPRDRGGPKGRHAPARRRADRARLARPACANRDARSEPVASPPRCSGERDRRRPPHGGPVARYQDGRHLTIGE